MGTIWIREFTGGLDTRRMPETTSGGVLIVGQDGHITRGGEFEVRAAFVPAYTLPAGATVGLANTTAGIVVFGADAAPTLPAGVTYQQLVDTTGQELVEVPSFDLYAGRIYAAGQFADGSVSHFYDGVRVDDWYDGRARASFRVTGGVSGDELTALLVNGVAIISGAVAWVTDHATTAAAIAAAINSHTSSPEYTATSVGTQVNIIAAAGSGAAANGYAVNFAVSGEFTVSPSVGLALAGGADASDTYEPGTFVRTFGTKMYALSGPALHGSGIQQPTKWTTDATGAFFIDMSTQSSGAEQLVAVAPYQGSLAVFSDETVQIEYVDPDPTLNRLSQVLNNTGAISGRSVTQFGDSDLFYCSVSGLRSLRARDSSNAASTTDIGVPVDDLITAKIAELTDAERSRIIGLIEPRDGRFWLIMKDTIFVFSYFSGAKVSAWSIYKPGFDVEYAVVFRRRVYLRSGDTIYVFGGLGAELAYDDTRAVAQIPYLDGDEPYTMKTWTGVDAAMIGVWEVEALMDPRAPEAADKLAVLDGTTYGLDRNQAIGKSAYVSLRFTSQGGYARLASAAIHYNEKLARDGAS